MVKTYMCRRMEKRIMKVRALFITLLLLSIAFPAFSAADLSKLTRLEGVSLYVDEDESRLVVRFNRVRGVKTDPQFFEKSIQMDIEDAYINPSRRNFELGGRIFKSASAYQMSPTKVRLRFFLAGDPRELATGQKVTLNGNLMIVTLKNSLLPPLAGLAPEEKGGADTEKPVDTYKALYPPDTPRFRATTDPGAQIEEEPMAVKKADRKRKPALRPVKPDEKLKKTPRGQFPNMFGKKAEAGEVIERKPKATPGEGFLDYKDPEAPKAPGLTGMALKMVIALSFTLAAVFFLAWIGKKYMGKFGGAFGRSSLINVLATSQIDVKKRIAVVDIAGEVLVLGIAGDNIAMLSTIDDQEKADMFRRAGGAPYSGKGDEKLLAPIGEKIKTSPIPDLFKKAAGLLRIGEIKSNPASMRSLFDASSEETFEGNLASIAKRLKPSEEQSRDALSREALSRKALMSDALSRKAFSRKAFSRDASGQKIELKKPSTKEIVYDKKELVRRVTNAIKTKNGKLRIA
ncbi:hypothetical protein MNBD_NITROSPINAE02-2105 [hydrothermal vent metagenome]|uniref:Flagellar protein n=1 Tax=hydrothermal vent metagenome TaxID=652676 RepID=A0A3B1CR46_9ZZZZ